MFKVIKEYAGVQVGSIINLSPKSINYMIVQGYVEPIEEQKAEIVPENKAEIVPENKKQNAGKTK